MKKNKKIAESICKVAKLLYEKELTDLAGGNISVRDGNLIYINEVMSGPKYYWSISPDSIIVTDLCKIPVIGDVNLITREAPTHYMIYQNFPDINAVIHCHPLYPLVFASAHMNIPNVSEMSRVMIGEQPIEFIEETVPSSKIQAKRVVENFKKRRKEKKDAALICTVPFHGLFVAGRNLNEALVYVDIVNNCAKLLIYRKLMFADNPDSDLSIRKKFTKEDFDTMNDFKEVCETGYKYINAFGEETIYKRYNPNKKSSK